jgi:hypothetical protein
MAVWEDKDPTPLVRCDRCGCDTPAFWFGEFDNCCNVCGRAYAALTERKK